MAVSSTPGKTKHFQTLNINESLMLCDCPGLVFPSFMRSTGEMLCAGVLPINQMRDYLDPANVMASRVPLHLLDAAYGMTIQRKLDIKDHPNRPPTGHEVLQALCMVKGYITHGTGNWDEFRACKEMLRDFNDGKILFVACPPSMRSRDSGGEYTPEMLRWLQETEAVMLRKEKYADRIAMRKLKDIAEEQEEEFDDDAEETADNGKREHKKLKRWGKKCRKLRNKTPYAEPGDTSAYVAYTTNRNLGTERTGKRRQDPRNAYGGEFKGRAVYPHHASAANDDA